MSLHFYVKCLVTLLNDNSQGCSFRIQIPHFTGWKKVQSLKL